MWPLAPGAFTMTHSQPNLLLTDETVASILEEVLFVKDKPAPDHETIIGTYRLIEKLGEGGFGVVWRAVQASPVRREVAVKIIKPGIDSEEVLARFQREQQLLARLEHPGISRVLDAGLTKDELPYIVMEMVEGYSITAYASCNALDLHARIKLLRQVCAALQYAHEKGVIHRDIKPSNLLVTHLDGQPKVKIIDFGIAKALSQEGHLSWMTQQQRLLGTPSYMSPEQTLPNSITDIRTDVYALGILLYEQLTGSLPFSGELSLEARLHHIREVQPTRPSPSAGDLDWITLRCLEKDSARRYPTMEALDEDLRCWQEGLPVSAHPPTRTYMLSRFVRRYRAAAVLGGMVLASIFIGAGLAFWYAHEAAVKQREALAVEEALISSMANASSTEIGRAPQAYDMAKSVIVQMKAGTFPGSPVTQRKLLKAASNAARNASDHATALWALEKAHSLTEVGAAASSAEITLDRVLILGLLSNAERDEEAVERGLRWLEEARKTFGDKSPRTLQLQSMTAEAMRAAEKPGFLELQLDAYEKGKDQTNSEARCDLQSYLMRAYNTAGRPEDALRLSDSLIPALRQTCGAEHSKVWFAEGLRASYLIKLGRHEEGKAILQRVCETQKKLFGREHPHTVWTARQISQLSPLTEAKKP